MQYYIATLDALGLQSDDVYIIGLMLACMVVFFLFGLSKFYESLFGASIGIFLCSIVVFLTFDTGVVSSQETQPATSFFAVEHKVLLSNLTFYIIFILAAITPWSRTIHIYDISKDIVTTTLRVFTFSIFFVLFFGALVFSGVEGALPYGFQCSTCEVLVDTTVYTHIQNNSSLYIFCTTYALPLVGMGIVILLFRILFADILACLHTYLQKFLTRLLQRSKSRSASGASKGDEIELEPVSPQNHDIVKLG